MHCCCDFLMKLWECGIARDPSGSSVTECEGSVIAVAERKRATNRSWTFEEEAAVIDLWPNYPCLYNTSCVDYKRHDKRAAAMAIKTKLEEQFNDSLIGMLQFLYCPQTMGKYVNIFNSNYWFYPFSTQFCQFLPHRGVYCRCTLLCHIFRLKFEFVYIKLI